MMFGLLTIAQVSCKAACLREGVTESDMPVSGSGVVVAHASYRPAGACAGLSAIHVHPLADDLGNADIGVLLDEPLIEGAAGFELVLTSDQWVSLLQQRRAAGRPLHLAEVH